LLCPDARSAQLLGEILAEQGIAVDQVSDSAAALESVATRRFDALILDANDEERAKEILSKARISAANSGTLVVALVASTSNVRQFFSMGANFVLYKPLSAERAQVSLKAARALMRRERRRAMFPVHAPLELPTRTLKTRSTMLDVSERVAIQSERRLPPSCKVYFQFTLPGQTKLVRLSGEIAWQDSGGRVGIRFVDVPQTSRRVLKEWLLHNDFRKDSKPSQTVPAATIAPSETKPNESQDGLQRLRSLPGNRRGESRHACTLGAEVYRLGNPVPNRCNLSDIGAGGCYVEMPSPFDSQGNVEIIVRAKGMKIRIRGIVQSVHPGFGMGVRFNLRDASEKDQVQQLVDLVSAGPTLEPKIF
jgi:CheY-like chemotaxis protein